MEDKGFTFIKHEKPFRYEEDGLTVTRGTAWSGPGCHIGCGVLLYTDKDGKFVKCEGDPENPFNEGRLCVRCLALEGAVNHKDRLKYPMKRAKEDRGKDCFERITWEEAFDLITTKFNGYKEEFGPESVTFWQGTGRDVPTWITRLCWSFGSPNWVYPVSGSSCYVPRVAACFATTGAFWVGDYSQVLPKRYDDPQWELPETIVLWGNNSIVSNADGMFGHWVVDCMKRGSKLITVDPRRTWLANKSEHFLQLRPGTDAALAMAMLDVIIKEDLYDHDFVDRWCYGFNELAERVAQYPPEKAEQITWVPADKIREAARFLAKSKNAIMQWGLAVDMTKEALPATHAISALFEITGNVEIPGGMIVPTSIQYSAGGWGREFLSDEVAEKRIGLEKYGLLRSGFQLVSPDELFNTLETEKPYPLKAAWLQQSNFIACPSPDVQRTLRLAKKLDFIVSIDLFMTPTIMALADVVLPCSSFVERDGIRIGDGAQRGEVINKVAQIGECKSDMEINLELGKRLNPEAWPWENVQDMFTELLQNTGCSFSELQELAPAYPPFEYHRHEKGLLRPDGKPGFNTPTGRIELWSNFYNNIGLDPLPYFEEPVPGPVSTPDLFEEYPLILTTGARRWSYFHSEHRQVKRLRAMHPDPTIEIHTEDCKKYGVHEGEWVWVENQRGRCKCRVMETNIALPGIASADHGWWYPEAPAEEKDGLFGLFDVAVNQLFPWEPGRSGFGTNYKSSICKVYPVKEGE